MNKSLLCCPSPSRTSPSKATAGLLKVYTGKDIDYDAYTTLLLSTASDYGSKHTVGKGKRQIYGHDLMDHDEDEYDASYEMYPLT
jgi:hypothetical protein